MNPAPMRGQVYRLKLGEGTDLKPYAVVSNNVRNRQLDSVLTVRITTTEKSHIPTAVKLGSQDPLVGFVLADDIVEVFDDELAAGNYLGALSPKTLTALNTALMVALGIP
jgi:mRNA interferase MazF